MVKVEEAWRTDATFTETQQQHSTAQHRKSLSTPDVAKMNITQPVYQKGLSAKKKESARLETLLSVQLSW